MLCVSFLRISCDAKNKNSKIILFQDYNTGFKGEDLFHFQYAKELT